MINKKSTTKSSVLILLRKIPRINYVPRNNALGLLKQVYLVHAVVMSAGKGTVQSAFTSSTKESVKKSQLYIYRTTLTSSNAQNVTSSLKRTKAAITSNADAGISYATNVEDYGREHPICVSDRSGSRK